MCGQCLRPRGLRWAQCEHGLLTGGGAGAARASTDAQHTRPGAASVSSPVGWGASIPGPWRERAVPSADPELSAGLAAHAF